MISSWEELGDVLAEFESRIGTLENSVPHSIARESEPISQPRPIVNVTYKIDTRSTPAFKELGKQIQKLKGRLYTYFEEKKKVDKQGKYTNYNIDKDTLIQDVTQE